MNEEDAVEASVELVLLEQVADTLPQAARVVHEGIELIVIDYETWKAKVRRRQVSDINEEGGKRDGPVNY